MAEDNVAEPVGVPHDVIRSHVRRILASKSFSESKRTSALLQFVVENALAGNGDRLKEAVLAVEVFGRETSFDGNADSIVRNAARRLRARLGEYYENEGRSDSLRIEIPRGGYVPVFRPAQRPGPGGEDKGTAGHPAPRRWLRESWRAPAAGMAIGLLLLGIGAWVVALRGGKPKTQTGTAGLSNLIPIRLYSATVDRLAAFDPTSATSLLEKAIQADPASPVLHLQLSRTWRSLGYLEKARNEAEAAFRFRARLGPQDQEEIAAWRYEAFFDYPQAAQIYTKLVAESPANADYALYLAQALSHMGKLDAALATLDRAVQTKGKATEGIDLLRARVLGREGDYQAALKFAREAAQIASSAGKWPAYADGLLLVRGLLINLGQAAAAAEVREQAQTVCEQMQDRSCLARLLRVDGNLAVLQGSVADARKAYEGALDIARQMGNLEEQANILEGLAAVAIREKRLDRAKAMYAEARRVSDGTPLSRAAFDLDRADLALLSRDLPDSEKFCRQALLEAREADAIETQAEALERLGGIDALDAHLSSAQQDFEKAAALYKQVNDKFEFAEVNGREERVLVSLNRLQAAAALERSAASEAGGSWGISPRAHLGIAVRLLAEKKNPQAIKEAETAVTLARQQRRDSDYIADAYLVLLRALMQARRVKEADDVQAQLSHLCSQTPNQIVQLESRAAATQLKLLKTSLH